MRAQVIDVVGRGPTGEAGVPLQTPATERILELAVADAALRGSGPVRDANVVRALIEFGQGVAFDLLKYHVDPAILSRAVH